MHLARRAVVPDSLKSLNKVSHAKTQRRKEKRARLLCAFASWREISSSQTEMLDGARKDSHALAQLFNWHELVRSVRDAYVAWAEDDCLRA